MPQSIEVFEVDASDEDDRPQINYSASKKANNDWAALEAPFCAGGPLVVLADHIDSLSWDFYFCGGTSGILSTRAVAVIGREAFSSYELLPATLNGVPYFLPRCIAPLDCFDRARSVWRPFPSNPARVMRIEQFAFVENRLTDPLVFSIPEGLGPESFGRVFVTQSIKRRIESAGLRGFRFTKVAETSPAKLRQELLSGDLKINDAVR